MKASPRFWLTLVASLLLLAGLNMQIVRNERQLADGTVVRMELAPVDPRSLMQGDYMALRYAIEEPIRAAMDDNTRGRNLDGFVWIRLDNQDVAQFVAIDTGTAIDGAIRLQFRQRDFSIKLASNAWFFEEGSAERFQGARYGEFRMGEEGRLLLSALLDEELRPL